MFKKQDNKITTTTELKEGGTVVTETVETRTTADGKVTTTTKKITSVKGGNLDSSFKNLSLFDDAKLSGQTTVKKIIHTSTNEDLKDSETEKIKKKEKTSGKTLTERLGFKPKSKTKDPKAVDNCNKSPTCFEDASFAKEGLIRHNEYRAKHGVPPLKLSKQLCAYSKEWADNLIARNIMEHRTERKYGENIFNKFSSNSNHIVPGCEAVDSWYDEIKFHKFGAEPKSLKSGHFTQVIWKGSTEVGMALARNGDGNVIVVANYNPPGNIIGKFAENVPPPKN